MSQVRKSFSPKSENRETTMSPATIAEDLRTCLPVIAAPIAPCEPVPAWLARAAKAAGIPFARAKRYWHRRVDRPTADEYLAIKAAADAALRKQQIMEAAYEAERQRLSQDFPALARFLPPSLVPAPDPTVERRDGHDRRQNP